MATLTHYQFIADMITVIIVCYQLAVTARLAHATTFPPLYSLDTGNKPGQQRSSSLYRHRTVADNSFDSLLDSNRNNTVPINLYKYHFGVYDTRSNINQLHTSTLISPTAAAVTAGKISDLSLNSPLPTLIHSRPLFSKVANIPALHYHKQNAKYLASSSDNSTTSPLSYSAMLNSVSARQSPPLYLNLQLSPSSTTSPSEYNVFLLETHPSSPFSTSSSRSKSSHLNYVDDNVPMMSPGSTIANHHQKSSSSTTTSDRRVLFTQDTPSSIELAFRLVGAFFCALVLLTTVVGNVLVIIVVVRFHRMRTVTNILLASLAIADITVACLVMPFTVVYDVVRYWPWGSVLCHFWISCDVMCCTASILHLCCVAIDRFWAITRPLRYRSYISKRRLFCCIIVIWVCSVAISFIPIFSGWYHADGQINVFTMEDSPECGLNVNQVYATISSLTSFYLPLPIMFYVYFRILLVAERQSREIKQLEQSLQQNGFLSANYLPATSSPHHLRSGSGKRDGSDPSKPQTIQFSSLINVETGETGFLNGSNSIDGVSMAAGVDHSSIETKRHAERSLRRRTRQLITDTKAIRTLGIVMGVFCLCWLPFFIMYVISAYCKNCDISYEYKSGITWLGYINSALNPAIYAYLNKEFKTAFKRVLCCMPIRNQMENEREAMLDEISTTSRSYQRNIDRIHGGLDVPPTPGFISRTPSATPDTTNWPIIHNHSLMLSSEKSYSNNKKNNNNDQKESTNSNTNEEIPMQLTLPNNNKANNNSNNNNNNNNNNLIKNGNHRKMENISMEIILK